MSTQHHTTLQKQLSAASQVQDVVHIIAPPGLGVQAAIDTLPESERAQIIQIAPNTTASEHFSIVPAPMSRQECIEQINLPWHHPLMDLLIWIPEAHHRVQHALNTYGEHMLHVHHKALNRVLFPWIDQMKRWLEPLDATMREMANIIALGPTESTPSDLDGLIDRESYMDLIEMGLGCMRQTRFELNALVRYVLLDEMSRETKHALFDKVSRCLLAEEQKRIWPESLLADFDFGSRCRRQSAYFQNMLHHATHVDTPQDDEINRALWASATLGYLSKSEGAIETVGQNQKTLIEIALVAPHVDAYALGCALESYLKNTPHLANQFGAAQLIDRAKQQAKANDAPYLMTHLRMAEATILFTENQFKKATALCEEIFRASTPSTAQIMASSMLAKLETDPQRANQIMDQAIQISIQNHFIYGEFTSRTQKAYWNIQKGNHEAARFQLSLLSELIEGKDVGIITQADYHLTHALYWKATSENQKAIHAYEVSMQLIEQLEHHFTKGIIHFNLGKLHLDAKHCDKAYKHFEQARTFFIHLKHARYEFASQAWKLYALLQNPDNSEKEHTAYLMQIPEMLTQLDSLEQEARKTPQIEEIYEQLLHIHDQHQTQPEVAENGAYFLTVEGKKVGLHHRPVLRTVLRTLIELNGAASVTMLLERAWPDENMTMDSGKNRIRVAVSTLRKLGLGDALVYNPSIQGYELHAQIHKKRSQF